MKTKIFNQIVLVFFTALCICSCKQKEQDQAQNSTVKTYYNGDIITMETNQPQYAEVLVTDNGKIVYVGSLKEAEQKYATSFKVDLQGKTLLPGFIDPHSHFSNIANAMGQVNLNAPPIGEITSIPELLSKMKAYKISNKIPDGEWIFGTGYDDNQLLEKRHPTNKEIDAVLPNNPVYLDHISGHMGVANSMALQKMKVNAQTPNPPGGNIGRMEGSKEPNGLMQETAMYPFVGNMLQILNNKFEEFFETTQNFYAENGITTAKDGMVDRKKIAFFLDKTKNKKAKIDIVALGGFSDLEKNLNDSTIHFNTYKNGIKVQGTKIITDGSPQGKTAFFSKPYLTEVPGCTHNCKGLPSLNQEALDQLFLTAYQNNNQLFLHCNGDASIDMAFKAHEKACNSLKQPLNKDRRTIIIHSQFVRPDQLDTYVKYNFHPSYFTNHAYFWGDVHLQNLGKERAEFLSPIATSDRLGLKYTNHSDATVTPLNPLFGVWSAVNRLSRSGVVVGEKEKATPYQALKAITINAAFEYFDENLKGSLQPNKLADLVILDKNPLKVDPKEIKEIKIIETIKEGKTIYKRD